MKFPLFLLVAGVLSSSLSNAQIKSQDEQPAPPSEAMVHPAATMGSLLGLLDANNFMMRHSFSLSYLSAGGEGVSTASYTNSMFYRIADPLNLRLDLTLQGSKFGGSSLGDGAFNKLFISRAEMNYKPADNMFLRLEYRQIPLGNYSGFYSPYTPGLLMGDY